MVDDKIEVRKGEGIHIKHREGEGPIVSFITSSVPFHLWKEWDIDCKQNFGGSRFLKLWHDHCKSKNILLSEELEVLKKEIVSDELLVDSIGLLKK